MAQQRRTDRPTQQHGQLSRRAIDSVSSVRKAQISVAANGKQDETPGSLYSYASVAHSPGFSKRATVGAPTMPTSSSTSDRLTPEIYSPLFQISNLNLPRDRVTMNAWNRIFYDTNPIVRNAINLHASYPISKININCKSKKVQQFFTEMAERIDLYSVVYGAALEFWKHGECHKAGTMITLGDYSVKPIEEMSRGDIVITHTGKKKMVTDLKTRFVEDGIYEISLVGNNRKLYLTGNHPIWSEKEENVLCTVPAWKNKKQKCWPIDECSSQTKYTTNDDGEVKYTETSCGHELRPWNFDWCSAQELSDGDFGLSPIDYEIDEKFSKSITKDWSRLFGYFISEGCFIKREKRVIGLDISNSDDDINLEIKLLCEKLGVRHRINKQKCFFGGRYLGYSITHNIITDTDLALSFKKHGGEYSHGKKLSNEFMSAYPELQKEFLETYINGDGCVDKDAGRIEMATNSRCLANQLRAILGRLNICSVFSETDRFKFAGENKKYKVTRPMFFVRVSVGNAPKIFTNLVRRKQELLNEIQPTRTGRYQIPNKRFNGIITKIKSVKKIPFSGQVFNLEVEDEHSYVAEGIAVHNCFTYAELDKNAGSWKRITIQNPDYIHVRKSVIGDQTQISLRPDAALQRIISSNSPADLQLKRRIPKEILDYVKKGQNIPLDSFNVSHLKLLSSPYDIRGTSIIVSIYKDLMRYDKLLECKIAQADGMVNPLTLVKLTGDEGYKPTPADLEAFKTVLEEAQYDKDFKIVTHGGVEIQRVGFSGQVLDVGPDFEMIINNLYTGLMTPKALIQQESVTYASSSIGLEVLRQRYDVFRNMMKKWLEKKIFAPICELQDFFEYVDGEKRLEVPSIDFNHMNLYDMNDYISSLGNYVGQKQVSLQSLYRSLGLSYDDEKRRLKEERIDFVIAEKELAALQAMRLVELKSLDPEQAIPESAQPGIPGAPMPGGPSIPGVGGMGGELGGLGLPPLPSGGALGGGGGPPPGPEPTPPGGGSPAPGGGPPGGGI